MESRTYTANEYLDFNTLKTFKNFKNVWIESIEIKSMRTKFVQMDYHQYYSYATCQIRDAVNMYDSFVRTFPHSCDISKEKKKNIIDSFQEVQFYSQRGSHDDGLLEKEGSRTEYIYWII